MSWSAHHNFVSEDGMLVLSVTSRDDPSVVVAVYLDLFSNPSDEGEVVGLQDNTPVIRFGRSSPGLPCVAAALFNLADSVLAWLRAGGVATIAAAA